MIIAFGSLVGIENFNFKKLFELQIKVEETAEHWCSGFHSFLLFKSETSNETIKIVPNQKTTDSWIKFPSLWSLSKKKFSILSKQH